MVLSVLPHYAGSSIFIVIEGENIINRPTLPPMLAASYVHGSMELLIYWVNAAR